MNYAKILLSIVAVVFLAAAFCAADEGYLTATRTTVPVTPPDRAAPKVKPLPPVMAEGQAVSGRLCRLSKDNNGQWCVVKFDAVSGKAEKVQPRVLLCGLLEKMEKTVAGAGEGGEEKVKFRIWGTITNYRGKSYLLPRTVAVVNKPVEVRKATSRPTQSQRDESDEQTEPTAKEIIKVEADLLMDDLLRDSPARPILTETVKDVDVLKVQPGEPVAPHVGEPIPFARGGLVINRSIRLAKVDKWRVACFEADNSLREPPVRVLPSAMLQRAEYLAGSGGDRVLVISGRIMYYKQQRYLLPMKVLRARKLDRF